MTTTTAYLSTHPPPRPKTTTKRYYPTMSSKQRAFMNTQMEEYFAAYVSDLIKKRALAWCEGCSIAHASQLQHMIGCLVPPNKYITLNYDEVMNEIYGFEDLFEK